MTVLQERLCLWAGPLFLVLVGIGFVGCAGFLPPPSPDLPAEAVAALYADRSVMIRLGMFLTLASSGLVVPFAALIAVCMRRMPGAHPALAYAQLTAGACSSLLVAYPSLILAAAAFRPERDPQLTMLLNDLGWFTFILPFPLVAIQALSLGTAILCCAAPQQVFPRWGGYLNLWLGFLALPGGIGMFFRSGPFAWNGLFVFWIPLAAFFLWFIVMAVLLHRALRLSEADRPGAGVLF